MTHLNHANAAVQYCAYCGAPLELRERFGKLRPVCVGCGHTVFFDPKVAVVAFVTQGEQVLLVKRLNEPGRGKWALPAGFVDADEDPQVAVCRETEEETGVRIAADAILDVLHRPDREGLADIIIAYAAHPVGGALCAGDDADEAAWFAIDQLPEIALTTTERLIARWQAGDLQRH